MSLDNFLTIKETAKRLRVSERTVMRYIKAQKLRAAKFGQWRIQESDLENFFNINTNLKNLRKRHGKRKK